MEAHTDAYEHGRSSEEDQLVESDATSDIDEDGHFPRPTIPQYPEPHPGYREQPDVSRPIHRFLGHQRDINHPRPRYMTSRSGDRCQLCSPIAEVSCRLAALVQQPRCRMEGESRAARADTLTMKSPISSSTERGSQRNDPSPNHYHGSVSPCNTRLRGSDGSGLTPETPNLPPGANEQWKQNSWAISYDCGRRSGGSNNWLEEPHAAERHKS